MPQENKKLIAYLNGLRKIASETPYHKQFKKYEKYYNGSVMPQIGYDFDNQAKFGNARDYYNCIRPIVETKATIALDAQISTSVKPTSLSHANFEYLEQIDSVSDMINDVWNSVKRENEMQATQQKIVRDGLVFGIGIAKASWDQSADNGLGNVDISRINPLDFFPEPEASTVKNANYIFVRRRVSKFDLINQYRNNPKVLDIIDSLEKGKEQKIDLGEETNIVQGYENKEDSGQTYLRAGGNVPGATSTNFTLYECYLKDDTIFQPIKGDQSDTEEVKRENVFKYPNGRLIIYCGDEIIEDGPISYPFGFPFSVFNPSNTNFLIGASEVATLMSTQDKLTTAYFKLNELMMKYKSFLLASPDSINPADLAKNFDIVTLKRGASQPPILVTNKLSEDIQLVRQHIDDLKKDALSLARINEIMLSGERPVGANSGAMIRDLIESPMSSIREIQRNFKSFLVSISNKGITLIQLYYTQPRVMRLSGERFAIMNQDNPVIELIDQESGEAPQQIPQQLLNDLSLTQYECEIQTGSALPQSQAAIAATTMQLAKDGVFGDINNIDVKEMILKALDYPNYRAIIGKLKDEQEKMAQVPVEPQFQQYLKNISLNLGDILDLVGTLSPQVQSTAVYNISDALGLTNGDPDNPTPPGQDGIQLSFN
jgi:hypothetical protein